MLTFGNLKSSWKDCSLTTQKKKPCKQCYALRDIEMLAVMVVTKRQYASDLLIPASTCYDNKRSPCFHIHRLENLGALWESPDKTQNLKHESLSAYFYCNMWNVGHSSDLSLIVETRSMDHTKQSLISALFYMKCPWVVTATFSMMIHWYLLVPMGTKSCS